ncbi:MAG TPA: hypothetical protein VJJ20_01055 [Candidatus Paceibacterota bacterium]
MNKNITIGVAVAVALVVALAAAYWLMVPVAGGLGAPVTTNQSPVTSGENPQPGSSVHDLPVEPAAAVARKDLAARLSVGEGNIVIMQITDATWNDGCLGLGGLAESCLAALVPGFRVEMLTQGKTYFYRTDQVGASVRAETN